MTALYNAMTRLVQWSAFILITGLLLSGIAHANASDSSGLVSFDYIQDIDEVDDPRQALRLFKQQIRRTQRLPPKTPFDQGVLEARYWFHSTIDNQTSEAQTRRLIAVVPSRPLLKGYLIDERGDVTTLIDHDSDQAFSQRQQVDGWAHRWLSSPAFEIPAGSSVDVLVQLHTDGDSYIPLDVVDELELVWHIHNDTVSAVLFYSFSIAAILLFLLFGIAMRDRSAMLYAALFASAVLMMSAVEGFAFMWLWPDMPGWNEYSGPVLIYLFCALGFYVARNAAEPTMTRQGKTPAVVSPLIGRWLKGLTVISLVMACLVPWLPAVMMSTISKVLLVLMFAAHARAIWGWSRNDRDIQGEPLLKRNLISIIAAGLIAVVVVVLILLSLSPGLLPPYLLVHAIRLVFLLSVLATMATIISHVSALRSDYADSLLQQVAAAEREAGMNRELLEAEQRFNKVQALARLRQQQLAEASHDMKQPLISLRSTLDTITAEYSAEIRQQLSNAFSYLDNLCASYLESSRPELEEDGVEQDPATEPEQEPYAVKLVFDTVYRMFEADAGEKGIDLRTRPSGIEISATPTVVIRIVANIVSNAIRHSEAGRILVGVRRSNNAYAIVIADNGKGMSTQELERISQAYQKGPDSTGEGLGMAISKQLAEQNGMQLEISSVEGRGTCFRLSL